MPKDPMKFSIAELKQKLLLLKLSTHGNKAELVNRLNETDPSREWMQDRKTDEGQEEATGGATNTARHVTYTLSMEALSREVELMRRERAVLE